MTTGLEPAHPETPATIPVTQQPGWPDQARVGEVTSELAALPPLVIATECDALTERLAAVSRGEAFVLQGGDCAETFAGATADAVRGKLQTLLQMSVVLTYGAQVPIVKIGRMAGQFAKPRSRRDEARDGITLPAYRGDAINGFDFTALARTPDPARLIRAYHCSAATLNLCRAFTTGGYADLHQVHAWNQDFVAGSPSGQRYERLAGEIDRALAFMRACGADPDELRSVELYSSHEALVLDYEQALTRTDPQTGQRYDASAHFLWIGERTRAVDGPHVAFASGIANPVGVKLGPGASPADVLTLIERLNPGAEPGRLTNHPDGRRPGTRRAAAAGPGGHRQRRAGRLGLRPDARQHLRGAERPQDPPVRRRARGGAGLLRGAPQPGYPPGRHPHRVHRRQRHRVRRRQLPDRRRRPAPAVRDRLRPTAQPQPGTRPGVHGGRELPPPRGRPPGRS